MWNMWSFPDEGSTYSWTLGCEGFTPSRMPASTKMMGFCGWNPWSPKNVSETIPVITVILGGCNSHSKWYHNNHGKSSRQIATSIYPEKVHGSPTFLPTLIPKIHQKELIFAIFIHPIHPGPHPKKMSFGPPKTRPKTPGTPQEVCTAPSPRSYVQRRLVRLHQILKQVPRPGCPIFARLPWPTLNP